MTETIGALPRFDALRDEWNVLADALKNPLLRHEWFACAARAFHSEGDLRVVAVRREGRLVAAAPLVRVRALGRDRLELLGAAALYEPSGLLYADDDALSELVHRCIDFDLPLLLSRVAADSPAVEVLKAQGARRALVLSRVTHPSLAVVTTGAWQTFSEGLTSRRRKRIRSLLRRAATDFGAMRTETLAPSVEEMDSLLDTVMRVEASGWKGRRGSAMLFNKRVGQFFRQYCRLAAARGELRVSILHFGSEIAAAELDLEAHRRLWSLKIGFRESLAKYSPGLMLTYDLLRYAFSGEVDAFEFLGSAESWEEYWNPISRGYTSILLYPFSRRGLWGFSVDLVDRSMSKLSHAAGRLGRDRSRRKMRG